MIFLFRPPVQLVTPRLRGVLNGQQQHPSLTQSVGSLRQETPPRPAPPLRPRKRALSSRPPLRSGQALWAVARVTRGPILRARAGLLFPRSEPARVVWRKHVSGTCCEATPGVASRTGSEKATPQPQDVCMRRPPPRRARPEPTVTGSRLAGQAGPLPGAYASAAGRGLCRRRMRSSEAAPSAPASSAGRLRLRELGLAGVRPAAPGALGPGAARLSPLQPGSTVVLLLGKGPALTGTRPRHLRARVTAWTVLAGVLCGDGALTGAFAGKQAPSHPRPREEASAEPVEPARGFFSHCPRPPWRGAPGPQLSLSVQTICKSGASVSFSGDAILIRGLTEEKQ